MAARAWTRGTVLFVLLFSACSLILGISDPELATGDGGVADARVDAPDVDATDDPDAPRDASSDAPAATHVGAVSALEVVLLDGANGEARVPAVSGAAITIRFTAIPDLPDCVGGGTAPCKLGTNPPGSGCYTTVLPSSSPGPTPLDIGNVQIQAQSPAAPDAGPPQPPTATIPLCQFRMGEHLCFHKEGTNGTLSGTTFTDAQGGFVAADVGRVLVAFSGTNRFSFPITAVTSGTQLSVLGGATATADTWYIVTGAGPTPSALPFLNQGDDLLFSYPGIPNVFPPQTLRNVSIGDDFTLTAATKTLLASLDNKQDIGALNGQQNFLCAGCVQASGTGMLLLLESSTATEQLLTQCTAFNPGTGITVPAAHWDVYRTRSASLLRMRVLIGRAGVFQSQQGLPDPPNHWSLAAGHAYLLETNPILDSD